MITNAIVTAYCACSLCTGPHGPKPTASGVWPRAGITVAAPRWVKFGTVVHIDGVGRRVVQDRMARRFPDRWDVYFASHAEARRFGIKRINVTIDTLAR